MAGDNLQGACSSQTQDPGGPALPGTPQNSSQIDGGTNDSQTKGGSPQQQLTSSTQPTPIR